MTKDSLIYVAGHQGMVGSAIWRNLKAKGYRLIGQSKIHLNLLDQGAVNHFFLKHQPDYVFLAAAKVGGIKANSENPGSFIYDNLQIQNNVIHAACSRFVKKLLFLGSSCIYPNNCWAPITESQLLTGGLEPTNEWYAIAKIAGIKMCQAYRRQYGFDAISVMPTNLYGPNDNYDPNWSHVLPAFIRRFHEAKVAGLSSVTCWGTGNARREFLHVDDLAEACVKLMLEYSDEGIVNIGSSYDLTVKELAGIVAEIVGYNGEIDWDPTKPDGTRRKLLDSSKINSLGWEPKIHLRAGIAAVYEEFKINENKLLTTSSASSTTSSVI